MSSVNPPSIRAAQATTVLLPTFTCGVNFAASFFLVPRLLESPTPLMVRQWLRFYNTASIFYPAMLQPAAAVLFFLSWHFRGMTTFGGGGSIFTRSRLYLCAGLLCLGPGPYTWFVIGPTNKKIMRKIEETKDMSLTEEVVETERQREDNAKWLVDHWGMLNLPRGIMMGLAGILGLVAAV